MTTITTTDENGNTTVMAFGTSGLGEAELGVALYPGATAVPGATTCTRTPEGTMVMAEYASKAGLDDVATFFRDQFRARSAGRQLMETSGDDTVVLVLADTQTSDMVQVVISSAEAGSAFQIMATRSAS